jgi:hypothetical protein
MTETTMLSAEALLAADDRETKVVEMPEWGGAVKIAALSLGAFQDAQENASVNGEVDEKKMAIELIVAGLVEPKLGSEHVAMLRDKSIGALTRLMVEIATLSKVRKEDLEATERRFPADAE